MSSSKKRILRKCHGENNATHQFLMLLAEIGLIIFTVNYCLVEMVITKKKLTAGLPALFFFLVIALIPFLTKWRQALCFNIRNLFPVILLFILSSFNKSENNEPSQ